MVQRLPVRIRLDAAEVQQHPLRLGLSMDVDVNLHDKGKGLLPTTADNGKGLVTDAYAQQLAKADALIDGIIRDNLGAGSR